MRRTVRRFAQGHRHAAGQTLVEFSLVAPIMLVLIFGTIDLGRYIYIRATLEANAVQAVRTMTLLENRYSDCAAWSLTATTSNTLSVTVDANSKYSASQVAPPAGMAGTPSANSGLIYLYPAVATSNSSGMCSSTNARPSGEVQVYIEYNFAPWTPAMSNLLGNVTLTASAKAQSEY